jgi:hypothetical protein
MTQSPAAQRRVAGDFRCLRGFFVINCHALPCGGIDVSPAAHRCVAGDYSSSGGNLLAYRDVVRSVSGGLPLDQNEAPVNSNVKATELASPGAYRSCRSVPSFGRRQLKPGRLS